MTSQPSGAANLLQGYLKNLDQTLIHVVNFTTLQKMITFNLEKRHREYKSEQEDLCLKECQTKLQELYDSSKVLWNNAMANSHRNDFRQFLSSLEKSFMNAQKSPPAKVLASTWRQQCKLFEERQV